MAILEVSQTTNQNISMLQNSGRSSFVSSSSVAYDAGLREYMLKVYNMMATALGISGVVGFLVSSSPQLMSALFGSPIAYLVMFAPLLFVIVFSLKLNSMSPQAAKTSLFVYSALMGLSIAAILAIYTAASVAKVFFISASVFGAMSIYGYTTKRDLTSFGSFLMMGLIGLIIASLVNIFLKSPAIDFALSLIGVFIFIGLTAYDTQRLKHVYYSIGGHGDAAAKAAVIGALSLYMDFINIFLMLLRLFGERR